MGHALKYDGKTKILRTHSITECCPARALNETVLQKKLWMIFSQTAKIHTQQGTAQGSTDRNAERYTESLILAFCNFSVLALQP